MRETVDRLTPVWSTPDEELLRLEIGLDARHSTVPLSEENGGDFFLDIPSYRAHRDASSLNESLDLILGDNSLVDVPQADRMIEPSFAGTDRGRHD